MKIEISIYGSDTSILVLRDGALHYASGKMFELPPKGEVITPSEEAWKMFREELDQIDIWNWQETYSSEILDGLQWTVEIAYEDNQILTGGINAFPGEDRN
ncbi:MAG: hypothetical protein R3211_12395, partial [Balneolaceae bacterium]|nr:hypothetical protein [Balneolaceae bacterium]